VCCPGWLSSAYRHSAANCVCRALRRTYWRVRPSSSSPGDPVSVTSWTRKRSSYVLDEDNRCNRSFGWVRSTPEVATAAPGGVHLGKIGLSVRETINPLSHKGVRGVKHRGAGGGRMLP